MKKLSQLLLTCLLLTVAVAPLRAQENAVLDEIQDICTELIVASSQTGADAHKVVVFANNGNLRQMAGAIDDTEGGLNDVTEILGRLRRRIPNATVSNQYETNTDFYRTRSSRLVTTLVGGSPLPSVKSAVGSEIGSLMLMIKDLGQDLRQEITALKNSNN